MKIDTQALAERIAINRFRGQVETAKAKTKKSRTPRQIFTSKLMHFVSIASAQPMAESFAKGDVEKFKAAFQALFDSMVAACEENGKK